jgi:translation initiation factor IF-1
MVRNISGGTGTKSLARKLASDNSSREVPSPSNEFEKIAIVSKIHGTHCDVVLVEDNASIICHIRNKFRGRNKRNNLIAVGSYILVGLRDWASNDKHSDLLFVYDHPPYDLLPSSQNHDTDFLLDDI